MKSSRLLLILANFLPLTMADTCLGEYQLAGIIFGAIFGTLLITIGFAFILWFLMHKHEQAEKILVFERAHATRETEGSISESADYTDKGILTERVDIREHVSVRDKEIGVSFPMAKPRKSKAIEEYLEARRRRTRSLELLPVPKDDSKKVQFEKILRGLGFSIDRNDSFGIYIDQVLPDSPAEKSQNIFSGDRIRLLTISFDNMKFEDAVDILSLVTPYTIRLDLEREATTMDDATQTDVQTAQMIVPVPPGRRPSWTGEPPPKLRNRGCISFERLDGPKLTLPRPIKKKIIPSELDIEEKRIIHIVRHTSSTDRFIPRIESLSEGETYEIHRGTRSIQEDGYTKKIHEFVDMRTSRAVQIPTPIHTPSTMSASESESAPVSPIKRTSQIFTTDASIHVTDHIQLSCDGVTMPVSTPSPPPEEEAFIPIQIIEPSIYYIESEPVRTPVLPELAPPPPITIHMHVEPRRKPVERTPILTVPPPPKQMPSPPGFVEMRAKRIEAPRQSSGVPIVDRRVPPLPASALETDVVHQRREEGENINVLYQQIKDRLHKVYEDNLENKKSSILPKDTFPQPGVLSPEQQNVLEANRRRLERERQQLRDLGII